MSSETPRYSAIDYLFDRMDQCSTAEAAINEMYNYVQSLGFSAFVYTSMAAPRRSDGSWLSPPLLTRGVPPGWDREWNKHSCNDPYFRSCFELRTSLDWETTRGRRALDPSERACVSYLSDLRLTRGLTFPVHFANNTFSFGSVLGDPLDRSWSSLIRGSEHFLHFAIHRLANVLISKFGVIQDSSNDQSMSLREIECLSWAAQGKTATEIAHIIGVSPDTVKTYFKRVYKKLDVHTRSQALAKAYSLNLVLV